MNSFQESKNELEAAIRYAENAISSAQGTIESMEFRQQMAQKNYQEQTGREAALERELEERIAEVADLKVQIEGHRTNMALMTDEQEELRGIIDRMGDDSKGDSVTINQLRRDLTVKTSQAEAWRKEYEEAKGKVQELESKVQGQYDDIVMLEREVEVFGKKYNELVKQKEASSGPCGCQAYRDLEERATMPVIPRDVAIAIFREGTLFGVEAACDEIQGETINISESDYVGDFSISFERDIDLDDHIDFDWVRGKIGDYDEDNVTANLEGLCAKHNFECRIHGIDGQEQKNAD